MQEGQSIEGLGKRSSVRAEGPAATWPPNPPIGKLSLDALVAPEEEDEMTYLSSLLSSRYGLTPQDVLIKETKATSGWTDAKMLQVAILTLEGWSETAILEKFIDPTTDPDHLLGKGAVTMAKRRLLTPLVKELGRPVRDTVAPWNEILHPSSPVTEKKLQELEDRLGLPRTRIFGGTTLPKPNTPTGIYQTDVAIHALHRYIVLGQNSAQAGEGVSYEHAARSTITNDTPSPITVSVLASRVLSAEAKQAMRDARQTRH